MPPRADALNFHILTSRGFWSGAPLVIAEIVRRGHFLSVFEDRLVPSFGKLLDCDVLVDMSAIDRPGFYRASLREHSKRISRGCKATLMVDSPTAILNSLDKRRTHEAFPDLVPESFALTGRDNEKIIRRFAAERYVVVKPAKGWGGIGVERLAPEDALVRHRNSKDMIVQRYLPDADGVGRVLTLTSNGQSEIVCAYRRIPLEWRTGIDVQHACVREELSSDLRSFSSEVSLRSGLYLNGIDYVRHCGRYFLLEVNAVPAMKEPLDEFGIDVPAVLLDRIERDIAIAR